MQLWSTHILVRLHKFSAVDVVKPPSQSQTMFPIRDHNPSTRTPYVTYALIILNVGIFFSYVGLFSNERALFAFYARWALVPGTGELTGYLTSMFLHGGWMHLAGNMLFLWIFGDNLEDEMGHLGFTLFYLATGLAAGAIHTLSDPSSMVPTVGASGAIAGVMGGYLLLYPKARVDILLILIVFIRVFTIPAWVMLGLWFALQVFNGAAAGTASGVAYWAHVGGFIAGLVLAVPFWMRVGGTAFWKLTDGHPPHPETNYSRSAIPTVRRRR